MSTKPEKPEWYYHDEPYLRDLAVELWMDEAFGGYDYFGIRFGKWSDLYMNVLTVRTRGRIPDSLSAVTLELVASLRSAAVELTP